MRTDRDKEEGVSVWGSTGVHSRGPRAQDRDEYLDLVDLSAQLLHRRGQQVPEGV